MELLLGKEISNKIKERILTRLNSFDTKPGLCVLVNKDDSSSIGYSNAIEKSAKSLGYNFKKILIDSEINYVETILNLNQDDSCHAIMVTRPLVKGCDEKKILSLISPLKDVDVMNEVTLGKVFIGQDDLAPATAKAIMYMLDFYNIDLTGLDCLVIGRSISVGKPVSMMLLNKNASVTIAHSKTRDLFNKIKNYDLIVCAVGKPHFLDSKLANDNAIIIDAGIHYLDDGSIVGDVIPSDKVKMISKVPGGVGSITTMVLMENVLKLFNMQKKDY